MGSQIKYLWESPGKSLSPSIQTLHLEQHPSDYKCFGEIRIIVSVSSGVEKFVNLQILSSRLTSGQVLGAISLNSSINSSMISEANSILVLYRSSGLRVLLGLKNLS